MLDSSGALPSSNGTKCSKRPFRIEELIHKSCPPQHSGQHDTTRGKLRTAQPVRVHAYRIRCTYLIVGADILPERSEHDHSHHSSQEECDHQRIHDREIVDLTLQHPGEERHIDRQRTTGEVNRTKSSTSLPTVNSYQLN